MPVAVTTVAVKICGLTRPEDVIVAIDAGADALGFVLDVGKVQLDFPSARSLLDVARHHRPVGRRVDTIAVVGRATQPMIDELVAMGFDGVQAVVEPDGTVPQTAPAFLVPVFFDSEDLLVRVRAWAPRFVPPEGRGPRPPAPNAGVRGLINIDSAKGGGTGTQADWGRVAQLPPQVPIMLAGGLSAENVGEAIAQVKPSAVDVSSGVEDTARAKDHAKIRAFIGAVKRAGR